MTMNAVAWVRNTLSAAAASVVVLVVVWLSGFAGVRAVADSAKATADNHEPRITHIETVATAASVEGAHAAARAADHEARLRTLEAASVELRVNMAWLKTAMRTGKDPETGAVLPK